MQKKRLAIFLNAHFVFIALIGCQIAALTSGHEYLKEKPSFLQPCHLHDPNNGKCMAKNFENLFTNWRNGVPGLKGLSPIDPFQVKRLRLEQHTPNLADIKVKLTNVLAHGISSTKVLQADINEKDYTIELKLSTPKINIQGDYEAKGRLLILNLDGVGKVTSTIENLEYHVIIKANLKEIDGLHYLDIISISPQLDKLGNFNIHFSNLFGGNRELEDSAHDLFNNNWREISDIMRPAFSQTINALLLDRYKKIFKYVPADYFMDDLS